MSSIDRVLDLVYEYINQNEWAGACFATSAVMHVLLSECGIKSDPCIGVLEMNGVTDTGEPKSLRFDHGWVRVGNGVYDLAISKGLEFSLAGCGIRGSHCDDLIYGVDEDLDEGTRNAVFPFSQFMKISPYFDETKNLWDITSLLANKLWLEGSAQSLANRYCFSEWRHIRRA